MITMSISTMTGDGGQTSLWSGERVDKDSLRVEAYGTVDELNSFLGEAKHYTSEEVSQLILSVQRFLFRVGGQLASKDVQYIEPVSEEDVEKLTKGVHRFEEIVGLKGFVIPGSTVASAKLDICRTIARRAERRIIALSRLEKVPDPVRDFLYILARYEEFKEKKLLYKNDID